MDAASRFHGESDVLTSLAGQPVSTIHWLAMLALSEPSLLGAAALIAVVMAVLLWRPLFCREARDRRRRERNYRKVSPRRHQGPAVQLNLEIPKGERGRNGESSP